MTTQNALTLTEPDVSPGGPTHIAALLRKVEVTITRHYPELLPWVKAALAVSAIRCLADNRQLLALIAIGAPGPGKPTSRTQNKRH